MQLELKELTPFMLNGWTYEQLVHKEVWFVTRIYWGYFHDNALEEQKKLKVWDEVKLVKDPNNKYDVNATEVRSIDWLFLGFIRKELAAEIIDVNNFKVQIKNPYTGDGWGKKNDVGTEIIIVNLTNFKELHEKENKE